MGGSMTRPSAMAWEAGATDQRLVYWAALRARLSPYFLRSFARGSRVRKPARRRGCLVSASAWTRARATPWRIAPDCPVPFAPPLEEAFLPNAAKVIEKARWLAAY